MQTVAKLQEALPRARNADGAEGLRRLAGRCGWLHREAVSFKFNYVNSAACGAHLGHRGPPARG